MKVAVLSTFPPDQCGIGDYTLGFCRAISTLVETTVISYKLPSVATVERLSDTLEVRRVLEKRTSARDLCGLINDSDPDLLHVQSSTFLHRPTLCTALARSATLPIVATVHDSPWRWKQAFPWRIALETFYRRCRAIFVHSHEAKNLLVGRHGLPLDRLWILPLCVDLQSLICPPSSTPSSIIQLPKDAFVYGFFGFLTRGKGLEILLTAFAAVRKVEKNSHLLIIGGDGGAARGDFAKPILESYRSKLYNFAKDLDIQESVTFAGHVPLEHLPAAMSQVDVFVLPYERSPTGSGALSMVLAMGKPVVLSDEKYFVDLLGEQVAPIVRPCNARNLSVVMERLYSDDSLRATFASRAMEFALNTLSWKPYVPQVANVYASVLEGK